LESGLAMLDSFIQYALHPVILISVLSAWLLIDSPFIFFGTIIGLHVVLGTLEYVRPARQAWVSPALNKLSALVLVVMLFVASTMVGVLYDNQLLGPLSQVSGLLGLNFWPHSWPLLVQAFMIFLASEFIWYWIHRAEHKWNVVWRLSGHGAHHSFKQLNALNFGLNHPLELFFLALPAALIGMLFGVGEAALGATILLVTQASIAHSNLNMSSKWIDLFFTTNRHHIGHHSMVLEQSNTNYGCATLIWDRLFGTFVDGDTQECGTGPTEPTLLQKLVMPIREPRDTTIAPS
jgi:sterol desaturase/sphingolipid hydroxylase (fatty acid hydroxylase superfamily)